MGSHLCVNVDLTSFTGSDEWCTSFVEYKRWVVSHKS